MHLNAIGVIVKIQRTVHLRQLKHFYLGVSQPRHIVTNNNNNNVTITSKAP